MLGSIFQYKVMKENVIKRSNQKHSPPLITNKVRETVTSSVTEHQTIQIFTQTIKYVRIKYSQEIC